jgi:uncharacterized protein YegL
MPKMLITNQNALTTYNSGTFQFSAARPETLGAAEYTLTSIVCDVSGSVDSFKSELHQMIQNIVEACQKTSRIDNLMLRLVTFDDDIEECHGFLPLNKIDPLAYPPIVTKGCTSLFDATLESLSATVQYGQTLTDQDYDVNAILFVITDGMDNRSRSTPKMIKSIMEKARMSETLDSIQIVLIGVNDQGCKAYLENFVKDASLDQYVSVGDASPKNLAKLGNFISKSVSKTSTSLGSGQSVQLVF